jgi:Chaperone of endosialidase
MNPLIQLKAKTWRFVIVLLLTCFGLPPLGHGVVPAPDGGYPGGNTAEGQNALFSLTSGGFNTAVGFLSLRSNSTGSFNTAVGAGTLLSNTADNITAIGAGALLGNTNGINNTANGAFALLSNTIGSQNTAFGTGALKSNTFASNNTATGFDALFFNSNGSANTADGVSALELNSTGGGNTAVGADALRFNTTGSGNTMVGSQAGTAVHTASHVICIGAGVAGFDVDDSCFIGSIRGSPVGVDAVAVSIDSTGKLGTMTSSQRFKTQIKPMDKASEAILALKPVTFQYKSDKTGTPQFGLVAEEVAEVNPDLVVRERNGEIYTVRYDAVNAMLLNEFLKEHRKNEEQQCKLQGMIVRQQKQIEALAAVVQKVSAQLELNKPAPQVVENDQ